MQAAVAEIPKVEPVVTLVLEVLAVAAMVAIEQEMVFHRNLLVELLIVEVVVVALLIIVAQL